jgi:hypothetical protein
MAGVGSLLVGGRDPEKRLAIHRRHYQASLVAALLTKFPATAWLVGTRFVEEAAGQFVRDCPPRAPCIAEYGEDFPHFLSTRPGAECMAYLRWFAELEWRVGHAAVAVELPALTSEDFRTGAGSLADALLLLQPTARYLAAPWPVDDLLKLYLTDSAPQRYTLAPADIWIEVRGDRGDFRFNRLDAAEFVFRAAILDGLSIGAAAERALERDSSFDPGRSFLRLIAENLVIGVET